jgi:hypothetical protein
VGEQLSAPLRISVRPVGHRVRGPSPACATVTPVLGAFLRPGHSRGQRREGSAKLFAVASFSRSRSGAPLRPAPFVAPRMRTPRGPSRSLWSLHRIASTSDVPTVTRRHTRVGIRSPPDVLSEVVLLAERDADFDLRVRGPLLRPAGESKTGISPRTPSIVSRTCKPKPAGRTRRDL